jgi:hypothetical protein
MSPELIQKLKDKYPVILEKSYDYSFDNGWYNIVECAINLIQIHLENRNQVDNFRFTQLKEKFSSLRIYREGYYDEYIDGVIRFAESISSKTCEVTGKPGQKCVKGGWIRTLCEEQRKILGFTNPKGDND